MGSKIVYIVRKTVKLERHEVLADGEQIAEFKNKADAYDFVDLCQSRDNKAAMAANSGTIDDLAERFPAYFRNPE